MKSKRSKSMNTIKKQSIIEDQNIKLSTKREFPMKDLLTQTTRVAVELSDDTLKNIKKDFFTNENEIDNLKIDTYYDENKKNIGLISMKDIDELKIKTIDKLKDINREVKMTTREYESDRLSKGFIYDDYKLQLQNS